MSTTPDGLDGDCPPWGAWSADADPTPPDEYECTVCHIWHESAVAARWCCRDLAWTR